MVSVVISLWHNAITVAFRSSSKTCSPAAEPIKACMFESPMKYSLSLFLSWRKADASTPCFLNVAGFRRRPRFYKHCMLSLVAVGQPRVWHCALWAGTLITLAMPLDCSNLCCPMTTHLSV